jgi:FHA domain
MTDARPKTPRTLPVADHLWETFSVMAMEMGSDREALINQALYTFARLNGFLLAAPAAARSPEGEKATTLAEVPKSETPLRSKKPQATSKIEPKSIAPQATAGSIAPQATAGSIAPQATAGSVAVAPPPNAAAAGNTTLVLLSEGRAPDRVIKDRFVIGRGKHCDLIINSAKVSREHAVITREGPSYFIVDLGSSNGTWFEKRRISRRQILEGDDYFICSEKLSCTFR